MLSLGCRKEVSLRPMEAGFNKFYGGSGADRGLSIVAGTDGGYLFAGHTNSNDGDVTGNHGLQDAWVVKLKNDGTIQWQKTFGGSGDRETANAIISSEDSGYVFVGKCTSNDGDAACNLGETGAWMVKLDKNGNILWQKIIWREPSAEARSIAATSDGYIISILDEAKIPNPYALVKVDRNGKILWQFPWPRQPLRDLYQVISSSDGQVIAVGSNLVNGTKGAIAKFDQDGNVLWHRLLDTIQFYGGPGSGYVPISVVNSGDGGYLVAGIASLVGDNNGWILKLDKDGFTEWQKLYGTTANDQLRCIIKSRSGGYLVAGNTLSTGPNGVENDYGWLFKIDETGNMLWQHLYSQSPPGSFQSVIEDQEGAYVMTGISVNRELDSWVVKVRE